MEREPSASEAYEGYVLEETWQAALVAKFEDLHYVIDAPMHRWTTFKVGGPADMLVQPQSTQQFAELITFASSRGIPVEILGGGSNTIVRDGGIRGLVIVVGEGMARLEIASEELICAEAGVRLSSLSHLAAEESLSGLEFAAGIPGTLGGALVMNAGAYGSDISLLTERVQILDDSTCLRWLDRSEMEFSYRHSIIQEHPWWVVAAELLLHPGDKVLIQQRMEQINRERSFKQPLQYPSAGSVFKRPTGFYAGRLIESCDLKGFTIGGAQVSPLHAGFIINTGRATALDIERLINHIQQEVLLRHGVALELEVRIIGQA